MARSMLMSLPPMTIQTAPIGILDSGFGGLSVALAVRRALPFESIVFAADCGFAPWGDKSAGFIDERVHAVVDFLLSRSIKALVLACNTATAVSIDKLRTELNIPIVGIEPAVFPGVRETSSGVIGVLATVRTIASERYRTLKAHALEWASQNRSIPIEIHDQPCPGLMECVEKGAFHSPETFELIERFVAPLLEKGADRLVLGCTHYPFLADAFAETIERLAPGASVKLIDPAPAVAKQLSRTLAETGRAAPAGESGRSERFFATGADALREGVLQAIWSQNVRLEKLSTVR